ncbi:MAG TPA: glycosyltransferase [Acetobacteraceae bacterium]|nr:glycosyltransferase [Acetobacteraceae bacterium]
MTAPSRTLLSVFATFAVGGPQVRFAAIANRFGARYRHMIVAMDGATAARERLTPDLDVTFPATEIRKGHTLANRRSFRAKLHEWRPDVLVTSNWGSIEWALANLPRLCNHIHIEDGFGPEEQTTQLRRRVLTRRLVLARSTVIVPSRNLERIATGIWGLSSRRVIYIPNGIDLARFARPQTHSVTTAFPGSGPVIGTVSALRLEKNFPRLLRAFRLAVQQVPARLVLVGDGSERPALERLATELGIADRIHFAGHVAAPAPFYGTFDLFALSSDTEQMPISVIEAMAAGLPVVSTDVGDVRMMLAQENAPFVGPTDDAALASSLLTLLRDPSLRRQVGDANRARAARDYDHETMFQAYAALFDGRR